MAAQVDASGGGHPFVEMGGHLLRGGAERVDVGGDYTACGVAEQHGFDVVPLARNRIDMVVLPQFFEYLVLAREKRREVDQNGRRLALDFPAPYADADAVVVDALAPVLQQAEVFLEFGVDPLVREVGTEEQVAVAEFADGGLRLGRDYGVDASHLVAYFPAHFKQIVRGQFRVAHSLFFDL